MMKQLLIFLLLSLSLVQLNAQTSTLFMKVENEFSLFSRPLPINTVILNLSDDKLYRLISVASVNSSLSSAQAIDLSSAANVFVETDPIWLSEKSNYATTSYSLATFATFNWVNAQNYLSSFTELDPLFSAEKASYALKTDVSDTAQVLRSEFIEYVEIDDIWKQSIGRIESVSPFIDIDKRQFEHTSFNSDTILVDSLFIPINGIVNIESTVLSATSNFEFSSRKYKISFKRINNRITLMPNIFVIFNKEEYLSFFEFDSSAETGYVYIRLSGISDVNVKWKININYKYISIVSIPKWFD